MKPIKSVAELIEDGLRVERDTGDMAAALKLTRQACALADAQGNPAHMASARVAVARYRFRFGQYPAAQELAQQALQLTSPPGDETAASHADALLMLGMCAAETGSLEQARQHYLAAAGLAREIGHPLLHLRALHNLAATVYMVRGQFSLALAADEEACQIARQHALHEWLYFPLLTLAWNLQITGQIARSRAVLEELRQASAPEGGGAAYYDFISAQLDMDEGVLTDVPEQLGRTRTFAERTGDPGLNVEVRLGTCRYHRLSGDLAKAGEWANDALEFAGRVRYPVRAADSLVERGRVRWLQGNPASAEADFQQAAEIYDTHQASFDQARLSLLQAALLQQQMRPNAAQAWLDFARQVEANQYTFLLEREGEIAYPLIAAYLGNPDQALADSSNALLAHLQDIPPLPLRIQLLGGLQVWRGKRLLSRQALRQRRAGELLGLLLTSPAYTLSAEQAAEALSPEKPPEQALSVVHHATSELRRALEPELPDRRFASRYLEANDRLVSLHLPPGSWLDVQAFEQAVKAQDWERAFQLYGGDFLPELRYAEWAIPWRERLSESFHRVLLSLCESRLANADWHAALDFAQRLIALDPWNEPAVLCAMRACQALNDLSAARRCYRRLEKTLRDELGVEPQDELQAFHRSLDSRRRK